MTREARAPCQFYAPWCGLQEDEAGLGAARQRVRRVGVGADRRGGLHERRGEAPLRAARREGYPSLKTFYGSVGKDYDGSLALSAQAVRDRSPPPLLPCDGGELRRGGEELIETVKAMVLREAERLARVEAELKASEEGVRAPEAAPGRVRGSRPGAVDAKKKEHEAEISFLKVFDDVKEEL